jgi:hypothetical protein
VDVRLEAKGADAFGQQMKKAADVAAFVSLWLLYLVRLRTRQQQGRRVSMKVSAQEIIGASVPAADSRASSDIV